MAKKGKMIKAEATMLLIQNKRLRLLLEPKMAKMKNPKNNSALKETKPAATSAAALSKK